MKKPEPYQMLNSFTERELDILGLIADGQSNKEIAAALYLTLGTVKWYNTQIFDKLGVKSRAQAIVRSRELGLLNSDENAPQGATESSVPPRHNLPTFPIPFVGRDGELTEIRHLLSNPSTRLLTLVGPGGMGKTRLAVEIAERMAAHFPDGIYFVSLTALNSADDIAPTLAAGLDSPFHSGVDSRKQLFDTLRSKRVLLVIDNFDSLLDGAGLVSELLTNAPNVKVMTTSRERLNLQEETVYRIEGLDVPEGESDAPDNSAVNLFLNRARATHPQYQPDGDDWTQIVEICRLVNGMPLGIVLAAAWIEMLSPREIAEEITRSLDFLQTEMRNVPERHRSLRGVFQSTWKMLSDEEQRAFARLSVFRGGFMREAAEQVVGASLSTLMLLAGKSLIYRDPDGRCEVHELLRQYAAERLDDMAEADATHDAHSQYYLDLLGQTETTLSTSRVSDLLTQLEADVENFRAAWMWAVEQGEYDRLDGALNSLYLFTNRRGRLEDGVKCFDRAIEWAVQHPDGINPRTLLRLREARGRALSMMGISHFEGAAADLRTVLGVVRETGDHAWERELLVDLGQLYRKTEQQNEAWRHLNEVLAFSRESGDARATADILYHMGTVFWDEGDNQQALVYHQEAVEISRAAGIDDIVAVQAFHGLGEATLTSGEPDLAIQNFSESLELSRKVGDVSYESENLLMIGWAQTGMLGIGDYQAALDYFPKALAISREAHLDWHRMCTHIGLGLAQGAAGDYDTGFFNVELGNQMAESVGLARFRSMALDALGMHYQDLNLFKKAEAAHSQGVNVMLRAESTFWLPRLQANRAIDRLRQGNLDVEDELLEALDMAISRGQVFHSTRPLEGLAELYVARGEVESALKYADQLLALAEPKGMREMMAAAHRWRGEALLVGGDPAGAAGELQQALELAQQVGRVRLLWDIHTALAASYRGMGDTDAIRKHESAAAEVMAHIIAHLPDDELRSGLPDLQTM